MLDAIGHHRLVSGYWSYSPQKQLARWHSFEVVDDHFKTGQCEGDYCKTRGGKSRASVPLINQLASPVVDRGHYYTRRLPQHDLNRGISMI